MAVLQAKLKEFYKERHGEGEPEEDEKEGRMAVLQAKLKEIYNGVFGPSDTKEDGEARKKLETKMGNVVEEAARMGKESDKTMEEKRKEAAEKLAWYSQSVNARRGN